MENNNITEKDKKLIEEADNVKSCVDWGIVAQLYDEAESDYAKEYLHAKMVRLYRLEERMCDCL